MAIELTDLRILNFKLWFSIVMFVCQRVICFFWQMDTASLDCQPWFLYVFIGLPTGGCPSVPWSGPAAPSGPEEWMRATNIRRMELEVWVCLKMASTPPKQHFWWGKWWSDNMDFGVSLVSDKPVSICLNHAWNQIWVCRNMGHTVTTVYAKSTGQSPHSGPGDSQFHGV